MTPTIGSRVYLRNCPHGEPGIVRGMRRGRIVVDWPDLMICWHRVEQLQPAADVPEASGFVTPENDPVLNADSVACGTQMQMVFGTGGKALTAGSSGAARLMQ